MSTITTPHKFNPMKEIKKSIKHSESNLLTMLDAIIHFTMTQESFDNLEKTSYYSTDFKKMTKSLYNDIQPIVFKDYNTVYRNGNKETLDILEEFEVLVRYLAIGSVPEKKMVQDLVKAFNKDRKLVASISKKVVKNDARIQSLLTDQQKAFLSLLDYVVNLTFLEKYLVKLQYVHYNKPVLLAKINKILNAVKTIIQKDFKLVFSTEAYDLVEFYRGWMNFLGNTMIDQKVVISQLITAWNIDKKAIEGTIKKTLN